MSTYYLGLSMAGTVSAGTYTAGCLIELNNWLSKWREACKKQMPVRLIAEIDFANYKKGDVITLNPTEIPTHDVKIKALTGASGGGVTAALYLIGLIAGDLDRFVKDIWLNFDLSDMLDTGDLDSEEKIYSALNSLPIDNIKKQLEKLQWDQDAPSRIRDIPYLDDVVEIYQTLTSFEVIPYNLVGFQNGVSGAFKNHFDYIRFGFLKDTATPIEDSNTPFMHTLLVDPNKPLKADIGWGKLIESTPATGAFPIGFRPRSVTRQAREYLGKLFYLKYATGSKIINYEAMFPNWKSGLDMKEPFDMKYFDGGTFNREPHDLARASLLRYFNLNRTNEEKIDSLPNTGKDAFASVILIDPFPSAADAVIPGQQLTEMPTLFGQPSLLIGSLMDQGRFHTDWIEKAEDKNYYSRFLIAPVRKKPDHTLEEIALAGEKFAAFAGFIDVSFREHDYKLGHYNTYKFLADYFMVPDDNAVVTYGTPTMPKDTLDKYYALGWIKEEDGIIKCQIIPRFEEPNSQNSEKPKWPCISIDQWKEVKEKALARTKKMMLKVLHLGTLVEHGIWSFYLKEKVSKAIDKLGDELREAQLLQ